VGKEIQKLIEVWAITERRTNKIFKTQYLEDQWVPLDATPPSLDLMYVSKSNDYKGPTIRTVDTNDKTSKYPDDYQDRDWHG
jgi:hypothetical protein